MGVSPSKTFNIAGLQVANTIIPNRDLRQRLRYQNDAAGYSQGAVLGMTALISCYNRGEQWFDELKEYLWGNISFVRDFLKENLPQITLVEPEGTYLIWLDFSRISEDYRELKKLIVDGAKLWVDPGVIFGRQTALFERINVACPRSVLEKAMNQLLAAVKEFEKAKK